MRGATNPREWEEGNVSILYGALMEPFFGLSTGKQNPYAVIVSLNRMEYIFAACEELSLFIVPKSVLCKLLPSRFDAILA